MIALLHEAGWRGVGAVDLVAKGKSPGECERCGKRELRYVHTLVHPAGDEIHVGCECARRLCRGYDPAKEEQRLRNASTRRGRWLNRDWRRNRKGNEMLKVVAGGQTTWVTVFPGRFGGFCYSLGSRTGVTFSPGSYSDAEEAKLAAFDALEERT